VPELAYQNGKILPISEAMVSVEDRGYQFADAVYEVIMGSQGRPFALQKHLNRLHRSMSALDFPELSLDLVKEGILKVNEASEIPDSVIYLQVSRGNQVRSHLPEREMNPVLTITVRRADETPVRPLSPGVSAITVPDERWGRCDIKTVQLLPNAMAKTRAEKNGASDAIFLGPENVVREATSSNVFIVKDGVFYTHPLTPNILPGITREIFIQSQAKAGHEVVEEIFSVERLLGADEVFLTGTITRVLPITKVDDIPIGTGRPGPGAAAFLELLIEEIRTQK
jgi:D-alanine transaminase